MPETPATPLFDALAAKAKDLFWAYDGPATFPDPDAPGKLIAYGPWEAVDDLQLLEDEEAYLAAVFESPGQWYALDEISERYTLPAEVTIALYLGRSVRWTAPQEKRADIRNQLVDPNGEMFDEFTEALRDAVLADEAVEAEYRRRWALTGREDEEAGLLSLEPEPESGTSQPDSESM